MAGKKETPRQKMIGMMYLVLMAMLALNVSKEVLDAFVLVDEGLVKTTENFNSEKISESLMSDWHLKSAILKLIDEEDLPLSLQDIGKKLSGEYFDGNYNLILNEIEQLEKEGFLEGTSKGGKVLFRKKA